MARRRPPNQRLDPAWRHRAAGPRSRSCLGRVAGQYTITNQRAISELSPFYIWTPDYAQKRLGWRRGTPLHVTLLRTHRIPRPVTIRVRPEHDFGPDWLEITRELPFEGTPVLSEIEFGRVQEEIESIVSGRPLASLA